MRFRFFRSLALAALAIIPSALNRPVSCQAEGVGFFVQRLESSMLATILSMKVSYRTTKNDLTSDDEVTYSLEKNPVITGISRGTLADSLSVVTLNPDFTPGTFEHKYHCDVENLDFWEHYRYESTVSTVFTDKKTGRISRFSNAPNFADSVTMLEYFVFADINAISELHMTSAVSPGAVVIPFVLRREGSEIVTALDGQRYDCWVYSAEIDNLFSIFVKLFYGDARIWVRKQFPHIRVKMDFFRKMALMRAVSIETAPSASLISYEKAPVSAETRTRY